jgi:hypothetical protein
VRVSDSLAMPPDGIVSLKFKIEKLKLWILF